jgi:hypothetical protein
MVALVILATALGGWRAVSMAATRPDPSTLVINGVSYTVTHAEQVQGLSDAALGGMSHGIQSLVTDDKALVTLRMVITAGDSPGSYDARALRVFVKGSSVGAPPVGGILVPAHLRARASIEGYLSFVVPRDGAQIVLRAPGNARELPLLQVDTAPAGAGQHQHPLAGSTAPKAKSTTPTAPKAKSATSAVGGK